ncbi:MAG: hypothetical protein AB7S70_10075, partial [Hyphomicrobium sp.]
EIIEATAASGDDRGLKLDPPSTASTVREKAVAHLIFRFLQNCPDDATVLDLREAVEESRYGTRV